MALSGIKVVEFGGLAPGPFCGLILADNGASVIRVDKPEVSSSSDVLCKGKRSISVSCKTPSGLALARKLITQSDVIIDPFRPGVMERMGLGPDVFLGKNGLNRRLIYARIVGFPRTGSQKDMAGHDINYLASSGVLSMLPGSEKGPSAPLNILADFAGGGLICAMGILLALIERGTTGMGKVVDTDMVSGARYISMFPLLHKAVSSPLFSHERGKNLLDGGAPFYTVYQCKDGQWMSVGCLEPQFFQCFLSLFQKEVQDNSGTKEGSWKPTAGCQTDRALWPDLRRYLEDGFKAYGREHWEKVFHGTDACCVPVLSAEEASARLNGSLHVTSTSTSFIPPVPTTLTILKPGRHTTEILKELNTTVDEMQQLHHEGAISEHVPSRL